MSAAELVRHLRRIFSTHGLPDIVVSDNGTSFTALETANFLRRNGIKHVFSPPYHPQSNGVAERMVQTVKNKLRQLRRDNLECRLSRLLFTLRAMPSATTGKTPAELLMNRRLKTLLHQVQPVTNATKEQRCKEDTPKFQVGDEVFVRHYTGGNKWVPATVMRTQGACIHELRRSNGGLQRAHINQIRKRCTQRTESDRSDGDWLWLPTPPLEQEIDNTFRDCGASPSSPVCRPKRTRRKPDFYGVGVSG
ncbi:uncharacterized protein K02A2.6-like [Ornithodoros turicata]|uniref:uncharacterized protein K02A2.6-like n=1 Tax=Ornithodoros turicata TaxID=34597 RepID=UPI003139F7B1